MQTRALMLPFRLLLEELISIPAWILWWYGAGFVGVLSSIGRDLKFRSDSYAIGIWIRNILVPMYGQYDWTGRFVSVFMRIVVIIFRTFALALETIFNLFLALFWLVIPIFAVALIVMPFILRV